MTKTIIPISPSWPVWTNAPVHLYHGTIVSSAKAILADGIEVTRGRAATDFGRGFYTTTDEENARMWSRRRARKLRGEASVIRLTLSRVALSKLEHIVFIRSEVSAVDYWSFVANCGQASRTGPKPPIFMTSRTDRLQKLGLERPTR